MTIASHTASYLYVWWENAQGPARASADYPGLSSSQPPCPNFPGR